MMMASGGRSYAALLLSDEEGCDRCHFAKLWQKFTSKNNSLDDATFPLPYVVDAMSDYEFLCFSNINISIYVSKCCSGVS